MASCFLRPETESEILQPFPVDDVDWLPDMASSEDKTESFRQRINTVETQARGISDSLIEIKSDLKWHRRIGWTIVCIFASAFVWMLTFYIPGKIDDKIKTIDQRVPTDFSERFGKMEANIQEMQERLNRITPASLNELIPSPSSNISEAVLTSKLRQASGVIDVAMKSLIPAAPGSLNPLLIRVSDIRNRYRGNSNVREAADAVDVRLYGYEANSKQLLKGINPVGTSSLMSGIPSEGSTLANFTMNCANTTGEFLFTENASRPSQSTANSPENIVVFDVKVNACSQDLQGPRWINDTFNGSYIRYRGGPLSLAGVTFKNCIFAFGDDPESQEARTIIEASKGAPVSLFIPK
jgi:hypothetical protein